MPQTPASTKTILANFIGGTAASAYPTTSLRRGRGGLADPGWRCFHQVLGEVNGGRLILSPDAELIADPQRLRSVEDDFQQLLAADLPFLLVLKRGDQFLRLRVEHLSCRGIGVRAVETEGDPTGLIAYGDRRLLFRRHHGVVEDVHHLVVAVAHPELGLVGCEPDAMARAAVPIDWSLLISLDLDVVELLAGPNVADFEP